MGPTWRRLGHYRCAFEEDIGTTVLFSLFWLLWGEQLWSPTMSPPQAQRKWSKGPWTETMIQNRPFLLISSVSQVFYHSNRKLTFCPSKAAPSTTLFIFFPQHVYPRHDYISDCHSPLKCKFHRNRDFAFSSCCISYLKHSKHFKMN
jgi:hypothetical protein